MSKIHRAIVVQSPISNLRRNTYVCYSQCGKSVNVGKKRLKVGYATIVLKEDLRRTKSIVKKWKFWTLKTASYKHF